MAEPADTVLELEFQAVTPERWPDLEQLFGPSGAYSGCWCMYWRLRRSEWNRQAAAERRDGLRRIVESGRPTGILAYAAGKPVAWCSIAPRAEYAALAHSRVLAPADERPVWSIVCFFVARPYRRQGLMSKLMLAAVAYARSQGAAIVEAYPNKGGEQRLAGSSGYMGLADAFTSAGFVAVADRPYNHVVVRYFCT